MASLEGAKYGMFISTVVFSLQLCARAGTVWHLTFISIFESGCLLLCVHYNGRSLAIVRAKHRHGE